MTFSAFLATSLDGFIAREDGGIDWLNAASAVDPKEDYGFAAFMKTVDVLVMGRNTFDVVRAMGGAWPYGSTPLVVLTTRPPKKSDDIPKTVEFMRGEPNEIRSILEQRGYKKAYVDGGDTIRRFLREGLISSMTITRIPIVIGKGIPLFGSVPHDVMMRHIRTRAYPTGLVQTEYEVLNSHPAERAAEKSRPTAHRRE